VRKARVPRETHFQSKIIFCKFWAEKAQFLLIFTLFVSYLLRDEAENLAFFNCYLILVFLEFIRYSNLREIEINYKINSKNFNPEKQPFSLKVSKEHQSIKPVDVEEKTRLQAFIFAERGRDGWPNAKNPSQETLEDPTKPIRYRSTKGARKEKV